ncbi:hypothetical protein GKZ90_0023790 [Flavobacterium sp. MC2016-06]|uniref:hypothetical protein n=1 Tax=Flavobacterium sp. MC2016-06 TaxID=2676308 RepID=UPI0012BB13A8|nr:hypothetical protein [Flavobacterium sp. MC2016-06]MBU3861824.1 hypothetical protein [Flavobacterium sp. MC2016-06]
MKVFEGEHKTFNERIFRFENLVFLIFFIFLSYLIFNSDHTLYLAIIYEVILFIIFYVMTINHIKTNIHIITFDENEIILKGERFNQEWKKTLNLKETKIKVRGSTSKYGLRFVTFHIELKNKNNNYIINSFQTFSDEQIIKIFNEFKNLKGEKIIIDEKLDIMRIQKKIEKCQ